MLTDFLISKYNFIISIVIMLIGFYAMIAEKNLIKKIIGMNIFQTSIFLFYISMAYTKEGAAPIISEGIKNFVNPIPHALILTAIVVSVSTTAVALAIVVKIYKAFGTLEEDEILKQRK